MRIQYFFVITTLLLLTACDTPTIKNAEITAESTVSNPLDKTDEMAQISYAMGANSGLFLARNLPEFENWGMKIDPQLIKNGFLESLEQKSQMSEQEIQTVLMAFQEQIKAKLAEIDQQQAIVVAEANKAYMAANLQKDGIMTTDSGIQYRIIEPGTGPNPQATDTIIVNYRGSLVSGEEFDSSYSRNEPTQFALNEVISGWTEGLQLIKVGGKIELVLPPELAYGDRALPNIPANSVLIFEVELLEIVKPVATESK